MSTQTANLTAHPAYAYSPRPSSKNSIGRDHAMLDQPLTAGRFKRERGDALCKPAKRFWGLYAVVTSPVTCPRCIELAERYGVELVDPTKTGMRLDDHPGSRFG